MTRKLKSKQKRELNSLECDPTSVIDKSASPVNAQSSSSSVAATYSPSSSSSSSSAIKANGASGKELKSTRSKIPSEESTSGFHNDDDDDEGPLENELHVCRFPRIVKVESLANNVSQQQQKNINDVVSNSRSSAAVQAHLDNINSRLANTSLLPTSSDSYHPAVDDSSTPPQSSSSVPSTSKSKSRRNRKKNKNNESSTIPQSDFNYGTVSGGDGGGSSIVPSRSSSHKYSGNNIVLVSNDHEFSTSGDHLDSVPPSCIDNFDPSRTIITSEAESILGLKSFVDSEDDDEDEYGLVGGGGFSEDSPSKDDGGIYPVITSVSSGPHTFSYLSASTFGIGPNSSTAASLTNYDLYDLNSNPNSSRGVSKEREINWNDVGTTTGSLSSSSRVRSPDSESSSSCGSCPSANLISNPLDNLFRCQASFDCFKLTNQKCSLCKNVYYCGAEHQKADWKVHKKHCLPYRVSSVGIGSDGVPVSAAVACRSIPEGQLIFAEKPVLVFPVPDTLPENQFTHVLDNPCVLEKVKQRNVDSGEDHLMISCSATLPSCIGCLKVAGTSGSSSLKSKNGLPRNSCSKCGLPLCSYHCQFLLAHQAGECEAIISSKTSSNEISKECYHTLYMDVEILRAMQLAMYDHSQYHELLEMQHNVRVEAYMKSERFKFFEQHVQLLVPLSAKMSGYNFDLILKVHSIISSLSFKPYLNSPYKMLFNTQPLFAHDCVPNTLHFISDEEQTGDPNRMKLVTKSSSAILKGTIITIDFVPTPYLPYPQRRSILRNLLNINNCQCPRCRNPAQMSESTSEIKCLTCREGSVRPETPHLWEESIWSCESCLEELSYSKICEIESDCRVELARIVAEKQTKDKDSTVSELLQFIEAVNRKLNPKHHLIITSWCLIEECLRQRVKYIRHPDPSFVYTAERLQDFETLGRYADAVEDHLNTIRPGIWLDKGIVMFHKFYSDFVIVSREHQQNIIQRKDFIRRLLKCLKLLQNSLKILQVYEGCNLHGVHLLTQEATKALSDLKCYAAYLFKSDKNTPLRPLNEVVNEQFSNPS